jgi:hypothetical protein
MRKFFIKRSSSSDYLLLFLIAGAAAVLGTRLYLFLLHYPQISRGDLHIAHTLFGGILLTLSNILLFSFHGKRVRQTSAVMGGFGFGLMIDEVGKFMTRDNDYFFQPVPMIIYLAFVTLFFLYRYFDQYTPHDPKELVYDLIENLEEIAENNFHKKVKKMLSSIITQVRSAPEDTYKEFIRGMENVLETLPLISKPTPKYVNRLNSSWQWLDDFTAERKPIFYFLLCIFIVYILNTFLSTVSFLEIVIHHQYADLPYIIDSRTEWVMISIQLISQVISSVLMVRGFYFLVKRRRIRALELFKNALAINILITNVFTFYFKQFSASVELLIVIVMYVIVHNILEEERS